MLFKLLPTPKISVERARKLRTKKRETPAEHRLWLQLENRQFKGLKFRRQAPVGPFIVDFLCVGLRLIIELDGAFHEASKDYDACRDDFLRDHGFIVLRFENRKVFEDCNSILAEIAAHISRPRPSP